jgi:hypothetical protein
VLWAWQLPRTITIDGLARIVRPAAEPWTFGEGIGRSRRGRTIKIRALTDAGRRPRIFLLIVDKTYNPNSA